MFGAQCAERGAFISPSSNAPYHSCHLPPRSALHTHYTHTTHILHTHTTHVLHTYCAIELIKWRLARRNVFERRLHVRACMHTYSTCTIHQLTALHAAWPHYTSHFPAEANTIGWPCWCGSVKQKLCSSPSKREMNASSCLERSMSSSLACAPNMA